MTQGPIVYRRVYVIGDIHGRSDSLDRVVRAIHQDLDGGESLAEDCLTVTLGGSILIVDLMPAACSTVCRVIRFPLGTLRSKVIMREFFEGFLRDASTGRHWWQLGGLQTWILRHRCRAVVTKSDFETASAASAALRATVPAAHSEFLLSLRLSLELDRYFFCHAGIRPDIPFDQQTQDDLLWIREEFLASTVNFGKIVVHGHTPVKQPEVLRNRINIDTAAFATGRLTCLVLEGARHRF